MSVNRYLPHVLVVPEDRANEQMANGFALHHRVTARQIQIERPAGGWPGVLDKFQTQHINYLERYHNGYVILLIDFDNVYDTRRILFDQAVPDDLKDRVFVIGAKESPEVLRTVLSMHLEEIGSALAEDCDVDMENGLWTHAHHKHNEPDLRKLIHSIKSILFLT